MSFSINPKKYGSVFVLPTEIADKYLKICSSELLRVLLVLYRVAPCTVSPEQIAARVGISAGEAADALEYWRNEGLVLSADSPAVTTLPEASQAEQSELTAQPAEPTIPTVQPTETTVQTTEPTVQPTEQPTETAEENVQPVEKKATLKPVLPSYKQIHDRLLESDDIRTLFMEAQENLGRTIGIADQGSLLLLHDFYGLPTDIILMLCGYAAGQGKSGNMRYITDMGAHWSAREIDTDEKAQAELKRLENSDSRWDELRKFTGIRSPNPTKAQRDYIMKWYGDFGFSTEMIGLAYTKMSEHTQGMSFSYMDKILVRWNDENIRTPEDVEKSEAEFEAKKARKAESAPSYTQRPTRELAGGFQSTRASYDIEKAMERALTLPKTTKKRRR